MFPKARQRSTYPLLRLMLIRPQINGRNSAPFCLLVQLGGKKFMAQQGYDKKRCKQSHRISDGSVCMFYVSVSLSYILKPTPQRRYTLLALGLAVMPTKTGRWYFALKTKSFVARREMLVTVKELLL